jgi:PAS domain S-box-containing protein
MSEGQRLRTLIVEDSEDDAQLLVRVLRRGGYDPDWERVETEDAMRSALHRREWDIVFCDFSLPSFDAPGALRTLRETGSDIPAIVVSGTIGEEVAVQVLKSGANDYLLKDNLARLITAVQRELRETEGRRSRRLAEAKKQHAEDSLRSSEERYRTLFECNPIPMWVYDRATLRFLQVNEAALAHYGYRRHEFLALSVPDLHPDEDAPAVRTSIAGLPNEGPMTRGTARLQKKDGTVIFVELVTQPITYTGIKARIAQALDITERKAAEEALSRIKMAVECASDAIAIMDENGASTYHNHAFVEMFGFTPQELNEAGGARVLFRDPATSAEVFATVADNDFWAGNAYLSSRADKTLDLFLRANAVRNAAGQNIATIIVCTDLREAKRTYQQITEQTALLDQAQDAIMVKALDGGIRYWNKGAERVFGWTAAEAIGQRVQTLLSHDVMAHDEATAALLRKGDWSGELAKRTKDGRDILIEGRWTLVRDDLGNPKSVLAIETDITEKRKIEAQFFRAQRMESIGTLASGMAHDLNNVLGPIMIAVDVLKPRLTAQDDRELLETVEVSAQRGSEMVKQVLSFARGIEGKRVLLQPEDLLEKVQKFARETFPKSIAVELAVPEIAWSLLGDPTQLQQVLINLAINARDAMPDGGQLRLAATNLHLDAQAAAGHPDARPGHYVVLEVADTGTGMSPEVVGRIFEPFFTTKAVGHGTGLGLSTTLAIARSHSGFITVESTLGQGTTFKVHLAAADGKKEISGAESASDLPRGNGECVLILDDEASVRSFTAQTLETYGYRVLMAADGAEGVAEYIQRPAEIAVVLTDMKMPIMDGMATIRALKSLDPDAKIIAMSGFETDRAEVEAAGARAFLAKPYTATTLLQALRDLLRSPGAASS